MPKTGPWVQVARRLKNPKVWLLPPIKRRVGILGAAWKTEFQQLLLRNTYTLTAETIAKKTRTGAKYPKISWLDTLHLANKGLQEPYIRMHKDGYIRLEIRFSRAKHPVSGVSYDQIAKWLEYGRPGKQAPRPMVAYFRNYIKSGQSRAFYKFQKSLSQYVARSAYKGLFY
jgi:hypothetical protein